MTSASGFSPGDVRDVLTLLGIVFLAAGVFELLVALVRLSR